MNDNRWWGEFTQTVLTVVILAAILDLMGVPHGFTRGCMVFITYLCAQHFQEKRDANS